VKTIAIYIDEPMCSLSCACAVWNLINTQTHHKAFLFGPDSFYKNKKRLYSFKDADCVIFPGGDGDADQFDDNLYLLKDKIQKWVSKGKKYLGICMGSYFAGKYYFNLLPGFKVPQYITRKKSDIKTCSPTVINLKWKGENKDMYFWDGAAFIPKKETNKKDIDVFAEYKNGDIAAMIYPYGHGSVGVIGPHPEAEKSWFWDNRRIINQKGWESAMSEHLFLDFLEKLLEK